MDTVHALLYYYMTFSESSSNSGGAADFLLSGGGDETTPGLLTSSMGDVLGDDDEEEEDEDGYGDGYMTYADVDQEFEELLRNSEAGAGIDVNIISPPANAGSLTSSGGTMRHQNGVGED